MLFNAFKRNRSNEIQVDELLSAYLDGMLAPAERARLEARLDQEPALHDRLEGLRRTVEALAELPEVELPRNFILSPSMVAPPKPAPQPRRRRTSPIFGWATAVATLMFLFVVAGDIFFIEPSPRQEPSEIVAQMLEPVEQVTPESERMERRAPPEEKQPEPAVPEASEGAVEASAAPVTESAVSEVEAAPLAGAGEEPQVGITGEVGREAVAATEATADATLQFAPPPPAPAAVQEIPEQAETPWSEPDMTVTHPLDAAVVSTPTLPTIELEEGAPLVGSPPEAVEKTESDADEGRDLVQMGEATPSPAAGIAPPEEAVTLVITSESEETDDLPPWLRLAEIGLGALVISLAAATLILRRFET